MNNNIKYELDLKKFMDNITIENKSFSKYEDETGTMFELNTVQLLTRVDYLELSTEKIGDHGASEYEQAIFRKSIDDLEYTEKEINKPVPKSEITGNDKDKFTIANKKVVVKEVWNVSNPYGAFKSFNNKEQALEFAKEINEKVKSYLD